MTGLDKRPRALVTGASSGLGVAFAEHLAQEGYDLLLVARRLDRLQRLADRLEQSFGVAADVHVADLADSDALAHLETVVANASLSLLVNNAGFGGYEKFVSLSPKVADQLIDVNVRALTRLTRATLPGMVERGSGAVLNVASLLALSGSLPPNPLPFRATYAAAKAYVLAFSQALAGELTGTGVQITVVLPGRVSTEFFAVQGMDMAKLPPMMTPADLVQGALSGLRQGETVCVPALDDAQLLDRLWEFQGIIVRSAGMQPKLVSRYCRD